MQDLQFSSPAKRAVFLANIAKHQAKIRAKQAQKNVRPAVENAAVPVVTTPTGAGQSVGHPNPLSLQFTRPAGFWVTACRVAGRDGSHSEHLGFWVYGAYRDRLPVVPKVAA